MRSMHPVRLALLAAALPAAPALAAICHVTPDGTGDGAAWNAPASLVAALADTDCTEIWLKQGTYYSQSADANGFRIDRNLALYGGFAGTEVAFDQRPAVSPDLTVLDGEGTRRVLYLDGVTNGSITSATVIDGLSIVGGKATGHDEGGYGGGLYCNGSGAGHACSPTLTHIVFSGNSATFGGAVFSNGDQGTSNPTLANVIFSGNSAGQGGAMYSNGDSGNSSPTLADVTFSGNSAVLGGGAMYNLGDQGTSSPALANVTFSGNSAGQGGAMYNHGANGTSSPALANVTFSGNSATRDGGAMYTLSFGVTGRPTVRDSVFWGNTALDGPDAWTFGDAHITFTNNLIQSGCADGGDRGGGGTCDGLLLTANPRLGPLQDNGGFTQTLLPAPGSPVIDAVACAGVPATDQRGVSRPQGARCDLGAVERAPSDPVPGVAAVPTLGQWAVLLLGLLLAGLGVGRLRRA